jgi:hypothetical protein
MYQLANLLLCTCTAVLARASEVPAKRVYEDICEQVVVSTPPVAAPGAYTKQSAPGALKRPSGVESGVSCSRTRARGGAVNRVNSRRW